MLQAFCFLPLTIVFSYLLVESFIFNSFNVDIMIFGTLSLFALLITEILSPALSKGCEIYTEKNSRDLLEEDPRDRVQKETDLLKWYDPRLLLMPIVMPLVKKCFGEVASELAERNMGEVNTNMSDVNDRSREQPKAMEFTQQDITV
jgi:hypothetical protein